MIKQFEKLTLREQDLLYKAPVLVSVLASCSLNEINKYQKADAIKLAHLKTFTAHPLLLPYYSEVETRFKEQFETALNKYFPFDDAKRTDLKRILENVNAVITKLDKEYARALTASLEGYARHVKKAAHTVFQDFVFPMPIPGLSS